MIFIVRVSDSERLSNSYKIFINVKILDSLKISDYGKNVKNYCNMTQEEKYLQWMEEFFCQEDGNQLVSNQLKLLKTKQNTGFYP